MYQAKEHVVSDYKQLIPSDYWEYYYTYEINHIKLALFLNLIRNAFIQRQMYLHTSIRKRLNKCSYDFKKFAKKLISRNSISNFNDYMATVSALILVNTEIDVILERLPRKNKKRFQKQRKTIEKKTRSWSDIDYLIRPHEMLVGIVNRHFTPITVLTLLGFMSLLLYNAFQIKVLPYIILNIIAAIIIFIVLLVLAKDLVTASKISKIYKTQYKYSYRYLFDTTLTKELIKSVIRR